MILRPKDTPENCMFLSSNMKFSYMRELLFSQLWEKTDILVSTRITFLRRELLLGKSTKNSLNLWQTRITQRNVILVGIVWESLILVWFLDENYIKPRRELSFSLLENDNSRLNIVILPLIRGENHVIRGTITVSGTKPVKLYLVTKTFMEQWQGMWRHIKSVTVFHHSSINISFNWMEKLLQWITGGA